MGSPGNLIDIYAAVDIPECEGFGLSQFHIEGLRQDSLTIVQKFGEMFFQFVSPATGELFQEIVCPICLIHFVRVVEECMGIANGKS